MEYHDQRENVISQQRTIYTDLDEINKIFQEKILNKYQKGHPFANIEQIKKVLNTAVEQSKKILKEAEAKHPILAEEDIHLDRITRLFEGRVGDHYPKDKLKKIYEEGQQRYVEKIPPGYEDERNKAYPFGDLVLWFQLIDYAKSQEKPIIFTIDDSKEDWWRRDKDKKEKILGPRPELIEEIHAKANVPFHMYLADEFIRQAQNFLKVEIHPGTIKEVKETREQQERDSINDILRSIAIYENEYDMTRKELHRLLEEKRHIQGVLSNQQIQIESMHRTKKAQIEGQTFPAEDLFPAEEYNRAIQRMMRLESELESISNREQELSARLNHLGRKRVIEVAMLNTQKDQTSADK